MVQAFLIGDKVMVKTDKFRLSKTGGRGKGIGKKQGTFYTVGLISIKCYEEGVVVRKYKGEAVQFTNEQVEHIMMAYNSNKQSRKVVEEL